MAITRKYSLRSSCTSQRKTRLHSLQSFRPHSRGLQLGQNPQRRGKWQVPMRAPKRQIVGNGVDRNWQACHLLPLEPVLWKFGENGTRKWVAINFHQRTGFCHNHSRCRAKLTLSLASSFAHDSTVAEKEPTAIGAFCGSSSLMTTSHRAAPFRQSVATFAAELSASHLHRRLPSPTAEGKAKIKMETMWSLK